MICSGDSFTNERGVVMKSKRDYHVPLEMDLESAGTVPIPGQDPEPAFVFSCPTCGRKAMESRPRAYWMSDA